MIRVYFLPVETISGTEQVAGIGFIHDALLDFTQDALIRKLTMFTTQDEHDILSSLASQFREATQEEIARFNVEVEISPPDPDYDRACELLASSPNVITQPEIWELLRIFGKRYGFYA